MDREGHEEQKLNMEKLDSNRKLGLEQKMMMKGLAQIQTISVGEAGVAPRSGPVLLQREGMDVYNSIVENCCEAESMVPLDFICGISKKIMKDPAMIASGVTFERASIQAWLDEGNTHCPVTRVPLEHLQLVPNLNLKNLISSWMTVHSGPLMSSLLPSSDPSSLRPNRHSFSSPQVPRLLKEANSLCFSGSSMDSASDIGNGKKQMGEPRIDSFSSACTSDVLSFSEGYMSSNLVREGQDKDEPRLKKIVEDHIHSVTDKPSKPSLYIVSRIIMLVPHLQSLNIERQRSSLIELRLLAKNDDSNRIMIANAGALLPLVSLLQSDDEAVQQEATTALLNLSLNEAVREEAIKAGAVESLVGVVKKGLTSVAMENAAVALTNLAMGQENKAKIGAAGAIAPLLELLDNGSLRGKKDAAAALYTLSTTEENKRKMVRGGATRLLVNFMSDDEGSDKMMDRAIAISRNLVTIEEGRVAFVAEGGINSLLHIVQSGSCRSKALSVAIFYQLCRNSSKHKSLILESMPLPLLMELSSTSASERVKAEIAELMDVLMESRKI